MRQVSARFIDAMTNGGTFVTRLQILRFRPDAFDDVPIEHADTLDEQYGPELLDGDLTVDPSGSIRRRIESVKLLDSQGLWTPKTARDTFSNVTGNEIKVSMGYRFSDGSLELLEQGYFGLEETEIEDSKDGVIININGYDRGRRISDHKFTEPYEVGNNINAIDALTGIISSRIPGTTFITTATPHTLPYQVLDEFSDGWEEAISIADSIGYEIFYDQYKRCVIRPIPTVDDPSKTDPAWTFAEGASATITKASRSSNTQDIPNGVIVTGANSYNISPPRAVAWDDDPNSATYYLGDYGKRPESVQSDKVETNAQAMDMATGRLRKYKGGTEIVKATCVPHPALEDGDLVRITRQRLNVNFNLILDQFNLPFKTEGAQDMNITTKVRRLQ